MIIKAPETEQEVIEFVDFYFNSMTTHSENGDELPPQDIVYNLTVHDLMSAFSKWELINAIPKTKESPEAVQPVK